MTQSKNLQPGTVVVHRDGARIVLERRKSESKPWPGWWIADGGGLADFVLDAEDSDWRVVEAEEEPRGENAH